MSYLVLARKWRPKRFAELVGQEHVVRALSHALERNRVHHAFLFTGTRGVGKTTLARLLAKSLNCEQGPSAEPCGCCPICQDVDSGRFVDLIEIDAASNTGVDDVRDVIEKAQYRPARGRYKVYLIDEVHMLSKAAFNALLKTLEEPPEHVKFLLATTDPQKIPVTVLSRCLQLNLKRLSVEQICQQLQKIMAAEQLTADERALVDIAHASDGSMRDALSLLDQMIAYAGDHLDQQTVCAMLGTVDQAAVLAIIAAVSHHDGPQAMQQVAALAEFSPDWERVLEAMAQLLHAIQVDQLIDHAADPTPSPVMRAIARDCRPELIQVWYQMVVNGRRDLPLAPTTRIGFEMVVLRMFAFWPVDDSAHRPASSSPQSERPPAQSEASGSSQAIPARRRQSSSPIASADRQSAPPRSAADQQRRPNPHPGKQAQTVATFSDALVQSGGERVLLPSPNQAIPSVPLDTIAPSDPDVLDETADGAIDPLAVAELGDRTSQSINLLSGAALEAVDQPQSSHATGELGFQSASAHASHIGVDEPLMTTQQWLHWVEHCTLTGPSRQLVANLAFVRADANQVQLSLAPELECLRMPQAEQDLVQALRASLPGQPVVNIVFSDGATQTWQALLDQRQAQRHDALQQYFHDDPMVQHLVQVHGATIIPASIRLYHEPSLCAVTSPN